MVSEQLTCVDEHVSGDKLAQVRKLGLAWQTCSGHGSGVLNVLLHEAPNSIMTPPSSCRFASVT